MASRTAHECVAVVGSGGTFAALRFDDLSRGTGEAAMSEGVGAIDSVQQCFTLKVSRDIPEIARDVTLGWVGRHRAFRVLELNFLLHRCHICLFAVAPEIKRRLSRI